LRADADCAGLANNTPVSYIDVVIAGGEILAGATAQCDISLAGGVAPERIKTPGRVVAAGRVASERTKTVGCVCHRRLCC
jgi:hypothetical protein